MKFAAIVFCVCAWIYVNDSDYRDQIAQEEERITDLCLMRGVAPSRDESGKLICTKPSPTWAMADPLRMPQ